MPSPEDTPVVTPPMEKLPPSVIPPPYLPDKSRLALAARVPPLIVNVFDAPPPIALTPPAIRVPLFRVNPPIHEDAPESLTIPSPFLTKPVPEEVDQLVLPKSRMPPEPTSSVLTFPPVPNEPPPFVKFTTTPPLTVMFPAVVVALVTDAFAVKKASLPFVHTVPPVGEAGFDQFVPVHMPLVPSVLQ